MSEWTFVTADDDELNEVLSGRTGQSGYPWPKRIGRIPGGQMQVGVLIQSSERHTDRPAALVVAEHISRRLFGRYSQLRSDLSPLSAWSHILDWTHFEQLQSEVRAPDLAGFEASWIGLSVAEALILSERPLAQLKLAACLATPTYAIARAHALWPTETIESVLKQYDQSHRLLRANDGTPNRLREPLMDVWRTLINVSVPLPRVPSSDLRNVTKALMALRMARAQGLNETSTLSETLELPQARFLIRLEEMPSEIRLREFDRLVKEIEAVPPSDHGRRNELQFLAGYLATVAAGGASSLGLAERLSSRWPQVAAWAYVIGGVGESITWTSGFDGLGRLVARELLRPFRLDDPPLSDFALAEAAILVDRALQDPLVHLRVKQSRVLSVALLPGVNVAVPISEASGELRSQGGAQSEGALRTSVRRPSDPLEALADALAPYLLSRLGGRGNQAASNEPSKRSGRSRGAKREAELPLNDDPDRRS